MRVQAHPNFMDERAELQVSLDPADDFWHEIQKGIQRCGKELSGLVSSMLTSEQVHEGPLNNPFVVVRNRVAGVPPKAGVAIPHLPRVRGSSLLLLLPGFELRLQDSSGHVAKPGQ